MPSTAVIMCPRRSFILRGAAFLFAFACFGAPFLAYGQSEDAFAAKALWPEHFAIELAGIVWVFAEVSILLLLIAAARHVSRAHVSSTFRLTRTETRGAVAILACLCALSAIVLFRHAVIVDPNDLVVSHDGRVDLDRNAFSAAYRNSVHGHLFVWMIFIGVWVLLEIAIVHQGLQIYRRLRVLLRVETP